VIISIIVAVSENGVIGRDGGLPWRLSGDLQRFKQLTMGHTVIMGRRTWESIGRQLPGRRMIVVSRQPDYKVDVADVVVAANLDAAMQAVRSGGDEEAFVIGGAELYRAALPIADRLYLTRVRAEVAGDTIFPQIDCDDWRLRESIDCTADDKNEFPHTYEVYDRKH
jgi:dihydrofolate reductase